MKTVFLFIYHRGCISDLLRGDYLKYLSSKYRVIVFLTDAGNTYPVLVNVTYIQFPLQLGKFWYIFDSYLRPYLIRRFDYLPGVQFRYAIYQGTDRLKNFLRRIALMLPRNFFAPRFFLALERIFVPDFKLFKFFFKNYRPSLVVTATPGLSFMEAWAILGAKKTGLPSVAINFSWDNLITYPRSVRPPDYLICWNEIIKKEALDLHGYRPENVFVSGILRYDHFFKEGDLGTREEFLISKNLDPGQKTILVATSTDPDPDLYKRIIRLLQKLKVNILVRIHPLERLTDYQEFESNKNVRVELAGTVRQDDSKKGWQVEMGEEDRVNVKKIFKFCDLNINRSSTISLDSLIFDMPVINLDFGTSQVPIVTFPHYWPLIEAGAVRLAHNEEELIKFAMMYLDDSSVDSRERQKIVAKLVPFRDGLAYKRNVDFLAEIIKK